MDFLHVGFVLLLLALTGSQGCSDICDCIFSDTTEIGKDDYVFYELRTYDYLSFIGRMMNALKSNWLAFTYIFTTPFDVDPPESMGTAICPTQRKHILGYFKNLGLTLCLVVKPEFQRVKKAECDSEVPPCGENTRCVPSGLEHRRYLVYCDAIYTDDNGCLIGADVLSDTLPSPFDESKFDGIKRRKRDTDETYANTTTSMPERQIREGCPTPPAYFAFRDDIIPTTCNIRTCNCG